MRLFWILLACCVSLSTLSCSTRHQPNTQIRIALPMLTADGVSAKTVPLVKRVMINITGAGIDRPIVWICETHDGGVCPQQGGVVSLTVPRGSARLMQVLVAGKIGSSEVIYYGDQIKDLSLSVETVTINLAQDGILGAAEGQIVGRYLSTPFPTDFVDIYYAPASRPPMIVDSTFIIAGWFSVPAKEGINFQYRLRQTGELLTLPDAFTGGLDATQARIYSAEHYSCHDAGGTKCDSDKRPTSYMLMGYFGPGVNVASHNACYPVSGIVNSHYYDLLPGPPVTGDTPMVYAAPASTGNTTHIGPLTGGTTICSGTHYTDHLKLIPDTLGWGNESNPAGFKGAYRILQEGPAPHHYTPVKYVGAGFLAISAEYLPDLSPGLISGTDLFYKNATGPNTTVENHDNPPCANLAGGHGYNEVSMTTSVNTVSTTIVVSQAELSTYLCPYKTVNGAKEYLNRLAVHRSNVSNMAFWIFTTPGAHNFTIPPNCPQLAVKMWGAGGGGGASASAYTGGPGGAGGFAWPVAFPVTAGWSYTAVVGKGGAGGSGTSAVLGGAGGGGRGAIDAGATAYHGGGAGGGGSLLKRAGSVEVAAGGGGGGGAAGPLQSGKAGGDGGGLGGGIGSSPASDGGPGGDQSGGGDHPFFTCDGGAGQGGDAIDGSSGASGGGGGGGGLYGGACGGSSSVAGSGGGGGSGFIPASGQLVAGSTGVPPSTGDADYATNIGVGGAPASPGGSPGSDGGDGRIVIRCVQ